MKVHYERKGQGPRVVFIQGAGAAGSAWRPQIDGLHHKFDTVTIDNRGIGKSLPLEGPVTVEEMARDVAWVMDQLAWPDAHLVGHSIGGLIAQQLALDHPRRVNSLSLLCTFGRGKDGAKLSAKMIWMFIRTNIGTRAMRRRAFVEMIFSKRARELNDPGALAQDAAILMGRDLGKGSAIAMKQVKAMAAHDTSARLRELKDIPVMVISAEEDPIAKPEYGKLIADLVPGATFEIIPDASHAVTIEKAELINARLAAFISQSDREPLSKS